MTEPRSVLFLHTQKTAGTAIMGRASEVYGRERVISHGDYISLGVEGCRPYPFISGHFGIKFAEPLMEGRYTFTFLRDPIERLLSLYSFCRTMNPDEYPLYKFAHELSPVEFFLLAHGSDESLRQTLWNHQTFQLGYGWGCAMAGAAPMDLADFPDDTLLDLAIEGLGRFDFIGCVENFTADFQEISTGAGWGPSNSWISNKSENRILRDEMPADAIDVLLSITELDRRLYEYARNSRLVMDTL